MYDGHILWFLAVAYDYLDREYYMFDALEHIFLSVLHLLATRRMFLCEFAMFGNT